MPTKTEAIQNFLRVKARDDLSSLYYPGMECQVNVASDGGERIQDEYKGRKWTGWTDGITTWKPFRIPYKAATNPEFNDSLITWDLARHVEAIGMTGWDWLKRVSKWVAFDFDDISSHKGKALTKEELAELVDIASQVPWVTIRKSTSGRGIHLYAFINDYPTQTHTEHAALARSILGKLSATTGYNFSAKVDVCGNNMWVWHRKTGTGDGLSVIRKGEGFVDVPINWRDHLTVVTNKRSRILPKKIEESNTDNIFAQLCGQRSKIKLDEEHKKLLTYLEESNAVWWWDNDNWMLVTHTAHLKDAHNHLCMRGFFDTLSTGKDKGADHNCFAFPMAGGAWSIRRYTIGVQEHVYWDQDPDGWTKCFLNRLPTFQAACRSFEGLEDPSGGYVFRDGVAATEAAKLIGIDLNLPMPQIARRCRLKQHKDGRIVAEVDHDSMDSGEKMQSWLHKKTMWIKIFNSRAPSADEPEVSNYDDTVRHIVTESGEDSGWLIRIEDRWRMEPLAHVRIALSSLGLSDSDLKNVLGSSIFKCWTIVNKPFKDEYPGNREWNRNAAQFRFKPTIGKDDLHTPHWDLILNHVGQCLDDALSESPWAKTNGLVHGADYLRCWIASMLQNPLEQLPYLFLYGPENSGKSILGESLSLLLTRGYVKADAALTSQQGHNGELAGAILCITEEIDIGHNKQALNRIKDWVTAREISIHQKYETPYHTPNSTHWIQTANHHTYCPIFPGDTRITVCYVPSLNPLDLIPKGKLIDKLEDEAPNFLAQMLQLEIPESNDRLAIPVISTEEKNVIQQMNRTPLDQFLYEKTQNVDGCWIKFSDFYEKLQHWLDPEDFAKHTKIFVGKSLPPQYPKGRSTKNAQFYIGNVAWKDDTEAIETGKKSGGRYVLQDANLILRRDV
jgi:hypothetical protein